MKEPAPFGRWLKAQRQEWDLTQAALAAQFSYTTDTIKRLEAGTRRPAVDLARQIAAYFGIPPADRAAFVAFARSRDPSLPPGRLSAARRSACRPPMCSRPSRPCLGGSAW